MATHAVRIALVGDYNPAVAAHVAMPRALALAARAVGSTAEATWVATDDIAANNPASSLAAFDGVWCAPGGPYASFEGAIAAIRYVRTRERPFLGTSAGFHHTLIEYARNVLHWSEAGYAVDGDGQGVRALIAPLARPLIDVEGRVALAPGSRVAAAYGATDAIEHYHCRFGLNPRCWSALDDGPLGATGHDRRGDVHIVELSTHPFFVATLFQPQRSRHTGPSHPLIGEFVRACAAAPAARGRRTVTPARRTTAP